MKKDRIENHEQRGQFCAGAWHFTNLLIKTMRIVRNMLCIKKIFWTKKVKGAEVRGSRAAMCSRFTFGFMIENVDMVLLSRAGWLSLLVEVSHIFLTSYFWA